MENEETMGKLSGTGGLRVACTEEVRVSNPLSSIVAFPVRSGLGCR